MDSMVTKNAWREGIRKCGKNGNVANGELIWIE